MQRRAFAVFLLRPRPPELSAWPWPRRLRRRLIARSDTKRELLAADPRVLQLLVSLVGHAFGQIHCRIRVEDLDAADVHRIDRGFIRDRADDVTGLHAMLVSYRDAIAYAAARRC